MKSNDLSIDRLLAFVALVGALLACSPADREGVGRSAAPLEPAEMKQEIVVALETTDLLDRTSSLTRLLKDVDASNLEAAVAGFEQTPERVDALEIRLLANAWSRIDPESALERFLLWQNRPIGRSAVAEVIHRWTRTGDAERAGEYAAGLLERELGQDEALRRVILGASATGLASKREHGALTELVGGIESDERREWVLSQVVIELVRMGGPELRAWVDSIPWEAPFGLKKDTLAMGMNTIARIDGAAAADWYQAVASRLEPGELLETIAVAWSAHHPIETVEWLLGRPESEGRQRALRATALIHLKADGPAASEWILSHEGDPAVKAAMLFPATQYMMSVDIQRALPMAERLDDELLKIAALKQILMLWSRSDYPAVEKYMTEVGVPPEVEEAVRGQNAIRTERQAKTAMPKGQAQ